MIQGLMVSIWCAEQQYGRALKCFKSYILGIETVLHQRERACILQYLILHKMHMKMSAVATLNGFDYYLPFHHLLPFTHQRQTMRQVAP